MTFNSGEFIQPQRALFSLPTREGQSLPTSLIAHKAWQRQSWQLTFLGRIKLSVQCYSDNIWCAFLLSLLLRHRSEPQERIKLSCALWSQTGDAWHLSHLINLNLLGRTMPSCPSSIDWGWLDSVSPIAQLWKSSLQQNPGTSCSSWALKRSALQLECASV